MTEHYLLLKVHVVREELSRVEEVMLQCGATSCTYQDAEDSPIHEPIPGTAPMWPDVLVTGIFGRNTDRDHTIEWVSRELKGLQVGGIQSELLADREWERAWMDDFEPIQVASNLWVVPTFCEAPDSAAVNISMDPGVAFGSGTHPTTHLCLQWLARESLHNKAVVDYGCGSGILSVAAALLGAERVYAYDIDSQALEATVDNSVRNGVQDKVTICHSDKDIPSNVDIVVANILLAPLLELTRRFCELLKDQGKLSASGVLSEQIATLAAAYSADFRHEGTEIREDWGMYSAVKQRQLTV